MGSKCNLSMGRCQWNKDRPIHLQPVKKRRISENMVFLSQKRAPFSTMRTPFSFSIPTIHIDEDRFILLGISYKLRIVVVCHCFRESDTVVRIISARKADGDEEKEYWSYKR